MRAAWCANPLIVIAWALTYNPWAVSAQDGLPRPDHTVMVMEENKVFGQIIGAGGAPYINELAARGALFTTYFAIRHPSQPNYVALFSGSTQGLSDDSCGHHFNGPNLASELLGAGLTFAGYSESMPRMGYHGCSAGGYQRKHNPWVNFDNVPDELNLPWTSFPTDFNELPTVAIVVPNQDNDMHDGPISRGDAWLREHISPYIEWAQTHNSLFILTWDEGSSGNHIVTIFVGPMVQPGVYSERQNHYSLLRTLLSMYGLAPIAKAAEVDPISSPWTAESSSFPVSVSLTRPADEAQIAGPASLELVADASANGAQIARVEFFENGNKLAEVTTPPYQFTVTNAALGEYAFAVQATDTLGRKKFSRSARVNVFNPFDTWRGTYQGLVVSPDSPSPDWSGSFALSVDPKGGFSAKMSLDGKAYRFTGQFDGTGEAVTSARLSGGDTASRLECALQIGATNGIGQLQGELSEVTTNNGQSEVRTPRATIVADRLRQRSPTNAVSEVGRHTLILLGEGDGKQFPGGHGFAQVTVSSAGAVKAAGRLAEGSILSVSSWLTERERWPLYQRSSRDDGVLVGWVWFTNGASFAMTEMGGELTWIRPTAGTGPYAAGFTNAVPVVGSAYLPPARGSGIMPWTSGVFVLDGAGYAPPVVSAVQLNAAGRVEGANLLLQLNPRTGLWTAKQTPAASITTIQGAVLQSRGVGLGFFLNPAGSGRVRLATE